MNIGPSLAHGLTSQKILARAHFGPTLFWPTMGRAKTEPNHSQSPSRLEPGRPVARHNPNPYVPYRLSVFLMMLALVHLEMAHAIQRKFFVAFFKVYLFNSPKMSFKTTSQFGSRNIYSVVILSTKIR